MTSSTPSAVLRCGPRPRRGPMQPVASRLSCWRTWPKALSRSRSRTARVSNSSLVYPAAAPVPALVMAAGDRAGVRFLEFFASAIRNPHTRRAYARAAGDFLTWCAQAGVASITAVQPLHVAAWIERQTQTLSAPTVKQRLAAIRHLFDWLVTGQVVPVKPTASVRGARHVVDAGQTSVLDPS